jgi:hypothetical protein
LPDESCFAVAIADDSASSPLSMPKRNRRPTRDVGTELRFLDGLDAM